MTNRALHPQESTSVLMVLQAALAMLGAARPGPPLRPPVTLTVDEAYGCLRRGLSAGQQDDLHKKYEGRREGRTTKARIGETRDLALRQALRRIRATRQRPLPTEHGHARLCLGYVQVIRGYQSDSSSKRPTSSFLCASPLSPAPHCEEREDF